MREACVDAEPRQAKGAARHPLGFRVERAMGDGDRIGAGAPIRADLERRDIVAFDKVDIDELFYFVADHRDRRPAGKMRGDAQFGLVARLVVRLVERHDDIVGRIGAGRAGPADIESDAGLVAVGRFDIEPMLAPSDIGGDFRRRIGGDVDGALRDALGGFDRLIAPMAVRIVPLISAVDLVKRPFDALARNARAVRRDGDRLERRRFAFPETLVEILLDADQRRFGADRQRDDALDRAPARLGDVDDDFRLEAAWPPRPPAAPPKCRRGPWRRSAACRRIDC